MREASPTTLLVISFLFVALLGTVAYARALDTNLTDSPVHSIGNDFESSFGSGTFISLHLFGLILILG
jgi:hypothetical protein